MQVIQVGDRARLLPETFQGALSRGGIGIGIHLRANQLHCYLLINGRIFCQVDRSHATHTQQLDERVPTYGCSNKCIHWTRTFLTIPAIRQIDWPQLPHYIPEVRLLLFSLSMEESAIRPDYSEPSKAPGRGCSPESDSMP